MLDRALGDPTYKTRSERGQRILHRTLLHDEKKPASQFRCFYFVVILYLLDEFAFTPHPLALVVISPPSCPSRRQAVNHTGVYQQGVCPLGMLVGVHNNLLLLELQYLRPHSLHIWGWVHTQYTGIRNNVPTRYVILPDISHHSTTWYLVPGPSMDVANTPACTCFPSSFV